MPFFNTYWYLLDFFNTAILESSFIVSVVKPCVSDLWGEKKRLWLKHVWNSIKKIPPLQSVVSMISPNTAVSLSGQQIAVSATATIGKDLSDCSC